MNAASSSSRSRVLSCLQGLGAPEDSLETLLEYLRWVQEWNAKTNLFAEPSLEALVDVLFADAAVLTKSAWFAPGARLVDVGAGGGAPALPLAILRPDLHCTLVEPRRRRVVFLRSVIGALGLRARVEVIDRKLDPERPQLPHMPYDWAMSRATFPPKQWHEIAQKIARAAIVATLDESALPAATTQRLAYTLPFSQRPRLLAAYDFTASG